MTAQVTTGGLSQKRMNVIYVMVIVVVKYIYINMLQTIKTGDFHLKYYVQNKWSKRLIHFL